MLHPIISERALKAFPKSSFFTKTSVKLMINYFVKASSQLRGIVLDSKTLLTPMKLEPFGPGPRNRILSWLCIGLLNQAQALDIP